jgi:hypothetical protein
MCRGSKYLPIHRIEGRFGKEFISLPGAGGHRANLIKWLVVCGAILLGWITVVDTARKRTTFQLECHIRLLTGLNRGGACGNQRYAVSETSRITGQSAAMPVLVPGAGTTETGCTGVEEMVNGTLANVRRRDAKRD